MTDALPPLDPTPPPPIRADGWIPIRQRVFLESLAETGIVTKACNDCDMSPRAAYTLRTRAEGIGFKLGWEAAILIARGRLVDELMTRAIDGWDEVITRSTANGEKNVTRHRIDNRLAMSLLGRLDKRAEVPLTEGTDAALARIIAQDFEAFLDLISSGAGGAAISLFLALRMPQPEQQSPCKNDDIGRCELCGDKAPLPAQNMPAQPRVETDEMIASKLSVWCKEDCSPDELDSWVTDFPPPPGFDGDEDGVWDSGYYERSLTEEEHAVQMIIHREQGAPLLAAATAARDAHFGFAPATTDGTIFSQSAISAEAGIVLN